MPTPVGHLLAGVIIRQSLPCDRRGKLFFSAGLLFFTLLPDIDFLFGFAVGDMNRYHHLFTHSFLFVCAAGLAGGLLFAGGGRSRFYFSAIFILAGTSHLLLDCLALDQRPPFGCPLLWPVSNRFFISPIVLFSDVKRHSEAGLFLASLFNTHNLRTVAVEIALLAPIWLILFLRKRKES